MGNKLANAILFQIVWIACVGGGGAGIWWLGPLAVLVFGGWQLSTSRFRSSDLSMVLVAATLGMAVERPLLAMVVGGVAGPISYWFGATTWGAVDFTAPTFVVLGALMIVWAVATPALVLMADRFNVRRGGKPHELAFLHNERSLPPTI
jgi:hypothetical protein